jgi:hypothetical protein
MSPASGRRHGDAEPVQGAQQQTRQLLPARQRPGLHRLTSTHSASSPRSARRSAPAARGAPRDLVPCAPPAHEAEPGREADGTVELVVTKLSPWLHEAARPHLTGGSGPGVDRSPGGAAQTGLLAQLNTKSPPRERIVLKTVEAATQLPAAPVARHPAGRRAEPGGCPHYGPRASSRGTSPRRTRGGHHRRHCAAPDSRQRALRGGQAAVALPRPGSQQERRLQHCGDAAARRPGCGKPRSRPRRLGSARGCVLCGVHGHLCAMLSCSVDGELNPRAAHHAPGGTG